ncbi:hypothetical protein LTR10_020497 [Elasticomyces elasticus]|uniref:Condensation domain-containing protein n=1 Tax=Exophiala sideris TaxID=1016849 RepID=A0ABR0J2F3_9EURO|nr:hypothetical protein LTR10_020497 [Elasticomyces elasticus]KAK5024703.1 hypothetical protein LTS07_008549 [Exophiala sideris]KAK5030797.1 hypothetical protein LTR13_008151 [Exophiala sideris]KAK5054338.1 hypothetical protein LTR69_008953 [Exophiala sideris]KAK5179739.1 hypothetical protein LTR44_007907 [Eurotiomycetes sp. CCFEE 6388]
MSWTQSSPGLHQRPLRDSEAGMAAIVTTERPFAREPIKIHAIASFTARHDCDKVIEALRDAWKALRLLKSPDIATTVISEVKQYQVPSPTDLEAWLDRTFLVSPSGTSVQSAMGSMQQHLEPLPVLQILSRSTNDGTFKGTLILYISHWRTEAAGAFKVVNDLFDYAADLLTGTNTRQALSKYTPGSEVHLLTPAVEDMLMPDATTTPVSKARVEKHFDDYYSKLPCIDFPMQGNESDPFSTVKVHRRVYTPSSTSNFIRACKTKGISITSAIHSAYLGAVWALADKPEKSNRNYASLMPAQVRTRLSKSSPYRDQGCWSAAQMLMLTLPPGQDFLTRAQDLRRQYQLADREKWLYEHAREISAQVTQMDTKTPPDQPVSVPWFTGLGLLDGETIVSEHGNKDITVEDLDGWADPLAPGIVLRLWTFRGKLNIHLVWNAAYHGDQQIRELMDAIDKTLADELDIDVDIEETKEEDY